MTGPSGNPGGRVMLPLGITVVPGQLGATETDGKAREKLHKLQIDAHTRRIRQAPGLAEKEWTSWTGATKPPAVRWTPSSSSPSGTAARHCFRSRKRNRCAAAAR